MLQGQRWGSALLDQPHKRTRGLALTPGRSVIKQQLFCSFALGLQITPDPCGTQAALCRKAASVAVCSPHLWTRRSTLPVRGPEAPDSCPAFPSWKADESLAGDRGGVYRARWPGRPADRQHPATAASPAAPAHLSGRWPAWSTGTVEVAPALPFPARTRQVTARPHSSTTPDHCATLTVSGLTLGLSLPLCT